MISCAVDSINWQGVIAPTQIIIIITSYLEFTAENSACVDIARVSFDALVVAEDLSSGSSGHGRQQEAVTYAVTSDTSLEISPVMEGGWFHAPHVVLEDLP
jgi:hypothetical protein